MNSRDAYKAKVEVQLQRAQAKLRTLKASAKEKTAEGKMALSKQIDALEKGIPDVKGKLVDLAHVSEDKWAEVKAGLEATWAKATESFKGDAAPPAADAATIDEDQVAAEVAQMSDEGLGEITQRVQDIDNSYRAVAEKMAQLYLSAEANKFSSLVQRLDKPMRNASENEQMFGALLEELHMYANRRK